MFIYGYIMQTEVVLIHRDSGILNRNSMNRNNTGDVCSI